MNQPIYHLPDEYDLEHAGRQADIDFYVQLANRWRPGRILELGCGTGRVTIPLAAATEAFVEEIVGLDCVPEMLQAARKKADLMASVASRLRWVQGDLRHWREEKAFDLIIAPGGTLCHLLSLEDQLSAWQAAFLNLNAGGRFVVDLAMAEFAVYAESMQTPPRAILEMDKDVSRFTHGERRRLLRCKAVIYDAPQQCATVHFLYDDFQDGDVKRFPSDYEHHVYYPRELELLFRTSGFQIESIWGDHREVALKNGSRSIVMTGIKPGEVLPHG